jgi:uncharacterized DUF497 family protein
MFAGLDWGDGNLEKCQKHGVSIEDIEALFAGEPRCSPDEIHSVDEQRFIAVGRSASGRSIFVVLTIRYRQDKRLVSPISARVMHAKEAARYGHS